MAKRKRPKMSSAAPGANVDNVRFLIHPVTSASLPSSYARPKKRLSHTVKSPPPSAPIPGMTQPVRARRFRRY